MRWLISQFSLRKTRADNNGSFLSTAMSSGVLFALVFFCIGGTSQKAIPGEKKPDDAKLKLSAKEMFKLEGEPSFSSSGFAFGGNGMIAIGDLFGKVFFYDSAGKKLKTLVVGNRTVQSLAFSPDNERIATSCELEKGFRVFDVAMGRELFSGSARLNANRLIFHPNGKELIIADASTIQVCDAKSGELRGTKGTEGLFGGMALSPDGKILAAIHFPFPGKVMRIWNLKDFEEKFKAKQFGFKESIPDLCFSPCGKWLAGASDAKKAYIWDVKTGELVHTFACAGKARSVAFSNDSKFLAIGISGESMDISFRDTSNGDEVLVLKKLDPASHIAFDRKSNRFARCGGSTVQVWELSMKKGAK